MSNSRIEGKHGTGPPCCLSLGKRGPTWVQGESPESKMKKKGLQKSKIGNPENSFRMLVKTEKREGKERGISLQNGQKKKRNEVGGAQQGVVMGRERLSCFNVKPQKPRLLATSPEPTMTSRKKGREKVRALKEWCDQKADLKFSGGWGGVGGITAQEWKKKKRAKKKKGGTQWQDRKGGEAS